MPDRLKPDVLEKAFQMAEIAKFEPGQKDAYETSLKVYRDIKNVVDTSFLEGLEEGIQKGLEEGIQKGLEEGIQKGLEEGIQKGKLELVRQMLKLGLPIHQIAQVSGLSEDEINNLKPNA